MTTWFGPSNSLYPGVPLTVDVPLDNQGAINLASGAQVVVDQPLTTIGTLSMRGRSLDGSADLTVAGALASAEITGAVVSGQDEQASRVDHLAQMVADADGDTGDDVLVCR